MPKITLEDATSGFRSNSTINANNTILEDVINNQVLFRNNPEGEPNQMLNALDMNSNPIINVQTDGSSGSLVTFQDLADLEDNIVSSPVLSAISDRQVFSSSSGDVTAIADHAYGYIRFTGTTPANYVINAGLGLLEGTEVHLRQAGVGAVSITANSGVTVNPPAGGSLILGGNGATVTLKYIGNDEYDLMGQVFAA